MIRVLINFVASIALAPAFFAFVYEGAFFVGSVFSIDATKGFLGGIVLFLLIYVVFLNGNIGFIEHLLHELEHAMLTFLFTRKLPTKMEIDPEKGSKVEGPKGGGCLSALAPYYWPFCTVPFLLVKAVASFYYSWRGGSLSTVVAGALDVAIGATLSFHFVSTCKEFGPFQKDVKTTGRIASVILVAFLNFVFVVLALTVVTGAYSEFVDYLQDAWPTTKAAYQTVFDVIETRVVPVVMPWIQRFKDVFCVDCTPTPTPTP